MYVDFVDLVNCKSFWIWGQNHSDCRYVDFGELPKNYTYLVLPKITFCIWASYWGYNMLTLSSVRHLNCNQCGIENYKWLWSWEIELKKGKICSELNIWWIPRFPDINIEGHPALGLQSETNWVRMWTWSDYLTQSKISAISSHTFTFLFWKYGFNAIMQWK